MIKTIKHTLIAALTIFSAIALPGSSDAQTVSGSWTGIESFSDVVTGPGGQIISESSGSNVPAVLSMFFSGFNSYTSDPQIADMSVSGDFGLNISGYTTPVLFPPLLGPQSAEGYVIPEQVHGQLSGYFDLTYQSILPDGSIDNTGGSAVANIRFAVEEVVSGQQSIGFVYFQSQDVQTVPEPSSLVLAVTATMLGLFAAWMRGFFSPSLLFVSGPLDGNSHQT